MKLIERILLGLKRNWTFGSTLEQCIVKAQSHNQNTSDSQILRYWNMKVIKIQLQAYLKYAVTNIQMEVSNTVQKLALGSCGLRISGYQNCLISTKEQNYKQKRWLWPHEFWSKKLSIRRIFPRYKLHCPSKPVHLKHVTARKLKQGIKIIVMIFHFLDRAKECSAYDHDVWQEWEIRERLE